MTSPKILDVLDEEECYLWAILSDPSGLDQAEFCITNEENVETYCFRAWAFQWNWWRTMDTYQIEQGSRSSGKSMSIRFRALAFPFIHPGNEMVITAPEGNHLDAITDVIETMYTGNILPSEMLVKGRTGVKHRPFHMSFKNGARIIGRIPQRDGKGLKGSHPIWLEMDESQDMTDATWVEIIETLKMGTPDACWRAHGVTRGIRDYFYKFTQPESGWKVHHFPAMYRPTWTDEEREEKIAQYGSAENPDYRRNIMGAHGDPQAPIFVLYRLLAVVDKDEESDYNTKEYHLIKIEEGAIRDTGPEIYLEQLPSYSGYTSLWAGMDVGYARDPSAITIFGVHKENAKSKVKFKLLARIMLSMLKHEDQVATIMYLIDRFKPNGFAMDKTGLGLPLFQDIQFHAREDPDLKYMIDTISGYNFSEKITVDFEDEISGEKHEVRKNVLEYSTDILRAMVDEGSLLLPWDKDLIGEFQGQTVSYGKGPGLDAYGRRKRFSEGSFHVLDSCRMAALAYKQHSIDAYLKQQENKFAPVTTIFLQ